ncbi:MAG: hypothetical protein CMP65_05085 [Flavobacteriales bacterium]|nr:hypothetical protein [Flavobacteriales bacterium]|tara:strand:+ start:5855 stop:7285 length:1431 start_codon:yes stop_codon:yes gene_type:complete
MIFLFSLSVLIFVILYALREHPNSTSRYLADDAQEVSFTKDRIDGLSVGVIGGGISGLSASKYLLESGARVTLFEKNNKVGGNNDPYLEGGRHYATTVIVTYPCQQPHYLNLCRELGISQIMHDFSNLEGAIVVDDRIINTKMGSGPFTFIKYILKHCSFKELFDGLCIMFLFYRQFKLLPESKKSIKDVLGERLVNSRVFTHVFMPWIGINTWCRFDDISSQPAHIFGAFIYEYALALTIRKKDFLPGENGWCVLDGRIIHKLEEQLSLNSFYSQHLSSEVKNIYRKNNKVIVETHKQEFKFDAIILANQPFQALPLIGEIGTPKLISELRKWPKMDCYVILHSDFSNIKNMPWVHQTYKNKSTNKFYITNTIKPIMSNIKFDYVITFVYNTENYLDFKEYHLDNSKVVKLYKPKLPIFTLENSVNRNALWKLIDQDCKDVYWTHACKSGIQYHNNAILNSKRVVKKMINNLKVI